MHAMHKVVPSAFFGKGAAVCVHWGGKWRVLCVPGTGWKGSETFQERCMWCGKESAQGGFLSPLSPWPTAVAQPLTREG